MESDYQLVHPFFYNGELTANASKSYFQRAMAIGALAKGTSILNDIQWSADTRAVKSLIEQLGAEVEIDKNKLVIAPQAIVDQSPLHLNVGESGLALRMFSSIVTLFGDDITLTGHGSLLERPVMPITETLKAAGVNINSEDNKPPLHIQGQLAGGKIEINGAFSSQILTGLLISLPLIKPDSEIHVDNLTSRPYIDMTLDIIKHFGVSVQHDGYEVFHIKGSQKYIGTEYSIEGDWSGAANHLVGAAISGEIIMYGLNPNSSQADRAIIHALELYGADIKIQENKISIKKNQSLPFVFDATQCPDIFPPLVVLAASCVGDSIIIGTDRLLHKESNRLDALIETFDKLGIKISQKPNQITIHGRGEVNGAVVDSYNDHRIAMAAAIAGCLSNKPIEIERAGSVAKSYPDFFQDLKQVAVLKH